MNKSQTMSAEEFVERLFQSVSEMKAGHTALMTKVEKNEVAKTMLKTDSTSVAIRQC